MPIDPTMLTSGAEGSVGAPGAASGASESAPGAFAGALERSIGALEQSQTQAADASQSLATGTASDPESAVMAVERARLAMQLAAQLRTTTVSAVQDLFHTQV